MLVGMASIIDNSRLVLLIACAAAVASCQVADGGLTREGDFVIQNRLVAIPSLTSDSLPGLTGNAQIKVSEIIATAPKKEQKLGENYMSPDALAAYTGIYRTRKYGAKYWLKNDADDLVKKSISKIFTLDKDADKSLFLNAKLEFNNDHVVENPCNIWATKTKFTMDVKVVSASNTLHEESYTSQIDETYCVMGQPFVFLQQENVTENIRRAVMDVTKTIAEDLDSKGSLKSP